MKKKSIIITLAAAFLIFQACNSNEKKDTSNENTLNETPIENETSTSLTEKRARLENQRIAREQKRAAELDALLKLGPYYTDKNGKVVYYKAEVSPAFIGGQKALDEYLSENLVYPPQAQEQGMEGTVFVDFVVLANGSVSEVEVLNDPSDDIDNLLKDEAVRVISNMPNWTPGKQNGNNVDVKFSLPVTFRLN